MRISDWSSDVCSSDLYLTTERRSPAPLRSMGPNPNAKTAPSTTKPGRKPRKGRGGGARVAAGTWPARGHIESRGGADRPEQSQSDRKSVGEGKRGGVSVVLGGLRISKKKKKTKNKI